MPRFQFSLGRLLACISAIGIAGAAWTNGFAKALDSKSDIPMFIGWMAAWLMLGAAMGFLAGNKRVVVSFLGAIAAFALLVVVGLLTAATSGMV